MDDECEVLIHGGDFSKALRICRIGNIGGEGGTQRVVNRDSNVIDSRLGVVMESFVYSDGIW